MEDITRQQNAANIQAASQRVGKPSGAGLALGLAGAGLAGYSAYSSLKAPSAGGGGGGSSGSGGGYSGGGDGGYSTQLPDYGQYKPPAYG